MVMEISLSWFRGHPTLLNENHPDDRFIDARHHTVLLGGAVGVSFWVGGLGGS